MRWFLSLVADRDALPGGKFDVNLYFSTAFTDSPWIPHAQWDCMTDAFLSDTRIRVDVRKLDAFGRNGDRMKLESVSVSKDTTLNSEADEVIVPSEITVNNQVEMIIDANGNEINDRYDEGGDDRKIDENEEERGSDEGEKEDETAMKEEETHVGESALGSEIDHSRPVSSNSSDLPGITNADDSLPHHKPRSRTRSSSRFRTARSVSSSPSVVRNKAQDVGVSQKQRPNGDLSVAAMRRMNPQEVKLSKTIHYLRQTRASGGDPGDYFSLFV
jgi:hypothetical protein